MAVDVGDGKKPISSSDDSIIRTSDTEGGPSNVYSTTHQSFLQRRQRHSSVPQTSAQVHDRIFLGIETLVMMRGPGMGPIHAYKITLGLAQDIEGDSQLQLNFMRQVLNRRSNSYLFVQLHSLNLCVKLQMRKVTVTIMIICPVFFLQSPT